MANAAPLDLGPIYQAAGSEWGVDPSLLRAIAQQESGENINTPNSSAGAQGLMQFTPGTASAVGVQNPRDPTQAVYGAAKLLGAPGGLLDTFGSPEMALAAYNAGPGRVSDYLNKGIPLPAETAAYVPGVARRYQALVGSQQQQPAPASGDGGATQRLTQALAGLQQGNAPLPGADPTNTATAQSSGPVGSSQPSSAPGNANPFAGMSPADFFAATTGGAGPAQPPTPANSAAPPLMSQTPPAGSPSASNPFASMSPTDFFAATAGAPPVAGNAGAAPPATSGMPSPASPSGGITVPAGDPRLQANDGSTAYKNADGSYTLMPASPAMTVAANAGAGVGHGFVSIPNTIARGLNNVATYVDDRVPALAALDRATGIDPAAANASMDAQDAAYQAQYGNSTAAKVGNLVGQTIGTLPVLGGAGAILSRAGGAIAAGADAVSPALGGALRATGNLLTGTAAVPDNAVLNAAVRPAALATSGAVQGAAVGALSEDPDAGLGMNMLTGAAGGAVLGPAGAGLGAGVNRLYAGAKALVQPFTAGGRSAIADQALARMAVGGPLVPDTTAFVPGSVPTLSQATANPGLAGVERAVASVRPNPFINQAAINQDAREGLVNTLRGGPADIAAAEQARDATALPAIQQTVANPVGPADTAPVVQAIDGMLASPAGQQDAVQRALSAVRGKLVTPQTPFPDRVNTAMAPVMDTLTNAPGATTDAGLWDARDALIAAQKGATPADTLARLNGLSSPNPTFQTAIDQAKATVANAGGLQTDAGQLWGIRKSINDQLSPLAANAGSDAQLAASELQAIKGHLDTAIEGAAPGFKVGMDAYAAASRPIDAMQYLQSRNFTAADGTITMAKVKGVLDDIAKQRALPGARDAKSLPQSTVDGLQGLYDDLLRQNQSRLGMQPGSNTFQQLATSGAMSGLGAPLAFGAHALGAIPVVGNALRGSIGNAYAAQNEPILDAVVNRLVNPQAGASVLERARLLQSRADAGPAGANLLLTAPSVNALAGRRRSQ